MVVEASPPIHNVQDLGKIQHAYVLIHTGSRTAGSATVPPVE